MLANLDDSVGAVREVIREEGLEKDTLVVFLSDNGGPTRELTSSNLPLRGGKGQMYEGGIRVPFCMSWPDTIPAGTVYRHPVSSLDLSASVLAMAGAAPDPDADGVDLLPYVLGKEEGRPHETLFWRQGHKAALRSGDWKIVRAGRTTPGAWELYHLKEDRSEARNLAEEHPERLAALRIIFERLNAEMAEPAFR
jgi:arylsulfatase B